LPSRSLASFLLLPLAMFASAGCAALGLGIGAAVDAGRGKGPVSRLLDVSHGRKVTLWLRDGSSVEGRYLGVEPAAVVAPAPDPDPAADAGATIVLQTKWETMRIAPGDVDHVSVPVSSGKKAGLLVGLTIDALVLLAAWQSLGSTN
jgi:hypothetical protein